ncbi:glycosyltransferase family 2 protein [Endothiovibrio diazotrophicus]
MDEFDRRGDGTSDLLGTDLPFTGAAGAPADGPPTAPWSWTLEGGAVLQIDRAAAVGGIALLSGWHSAAAELDLPTELRRIALRRADAEEHLGHAVTGFVAAARCAEGTTALPFRFGAPPEQCAAAITADAAADPLATLLGEQFTILPRLLPVLLESPRWGQLLKGMLDGFGDHPRLGAIDDALWVEGVGVAAAGRLRRAGPATRYYLVGDHGEWTPVEGDESLAAEPPEEAAQPGDEPPTIPFAAVLHCAVAPTAKVRLVCCAVDGLHPAATAPCQPAPHPAEFVRRLFAHPVAMPRYAARAARHDLALVEARLRAEREALAEIEERRIDYGRLPDAPRISVVVPLYGRWDFVEHQLLAFSADPAFHGEVELIYVVDDPRIASPLLGAAAELHALYRVPFSIVPGRFNRGFAGACNLGARFARGATLILFNSDLFPQRPGWADALAEALAHHPEFGVVGARLRTIDGGLQHDGIEFAFEPAFGIWINRHPGQGLALVEEEGDEREVRERPAVSGACMAVRREQFLALGGFDEGYLIGDFEDSDLCLKYLAAGLGSGLLRGVALTHLERQSLAAVGDGGFRQKVVIWNAVRHHRRWGAVLEAAAGHGEGSP